MKQILTYCLVIVLGPLCLTVGSMLVGFVVGLLLAWAPDRFRCVVSGTLRGIAGVAAAVAFGYFTFRFFLGPDAFSLFPFLAATVPLLAAILNDQQRARKLAEIRHSAPTERLQAALAPDTDFARFSVLGYVLGLVGAYVWYFLVYSGAA